jgi:hypothetical protein
MHRNQIDLVETCFEEGQYEAGLKVLDQLRAPDVKPPPCVSLFRLISCILLHATSRQIMRQIIYLALYPPAPSHMPTVDLEASPTKILRQAKRTQAFILPSISITAQRLLVSFALTNLPSSVFRAVPKHTTSPLAQSEHLEEMQSTVSKESAECMSNAKDAWSLLRPGFVRPMNPDSTFSKAKSSKVKTHAHDEFDSDEDDIEDPERAVAKYAWPVLEWMMIVLEKDERLTQGDAKNTRKHFSMLSLFQILTHSP